MHHNNTFNHEHGQWFNGTVPEHASPGEAAEENTYTLHKYRTAVLFLMLNATDGPIVVRAAYTTHRGTFHDDEPLANDADHMPLQQCSAAHQRSRRRRREAFFRLKAPSKLDFGCED